MTEALHIADRFLIHFFSAYGLVSGAFFFLNWLRKRPAARQWLPQGYLPLFCLAAILVSLIAFIREPGDIHAGDWWVKSYFDLASWLLGSAVAVWGNYRLRWVIIKWVD